MLRKALPWYLASSALNRAGDMGRHSTISKLPKEIRQEILRLISDGATIDEIVAHLEAMDTEVSRSAIGRYKQKETDRLKRYREAREVAGMWIQKMGEDPESELGMMLGELLKMVAFEQLKTMASDNAGAKPMDIMLLAKAIRDLETSTRAHLERQAKIRKQVLAEASKAAGQAARKAGISAEAIEQIQSELNLL